VSTTVRPARPRLGVLLVSLVVVWTALGVTASHSEARSAPGPLVVSPDNPRYFTPASGRHAGEAVYLTGSHLWNNLEDGIGVGTCDEPTPPLSFGAYLDFLKAHGHNFIRLWRWEHFKFKLPPDIDTGGPYCVSPQPWARSGAGTAWDGGPKFDLATFDQGYFDRLRNRVDKADHRGVYVSVMLFNGFCLYICDDDSQIAGHPFDGQNNINGVDIDSIADYESLAADPSVLALQRAYIRKVIDTVHRSDNVLYEVSNESWMGSTQWQYSVIDYIKQYEAQRGYKKHPVGMTTQLPGEDQLLYAGPADWISPGISNGDYLEDPPAADGTKVVVADTDHYHGCMGSAVWAWKSLTRGVNPILLDCGIGDPANPLPDFAYLEPARNAMGDTLQLAKTIDLVSTTPRGDLASTGYALARVGHEYVVLQPEATATPFTVTLPRGRYEVRWFNVDDRTWQAANRVRVTTAGATSFSPPFATPAPAVLYLKRG
jgi:hypothetical protein